MLTFKDKTELESVLFPIITEKIKNAEVTCEIITNTHIPSSPVWAVSVTAIADLGEKFYGRPTAKQQSLWYPAKEEHAISLLTRDMEKLADRVTRILGDIVFRSDH